MIDNLFDQGDQADEGLDRSEHHVGRSPFVDQDGSGVLQGGDEGKVDLTVSHAFLEIFLQGEQDERDRVDEDPGRKFEVHPLVEDQRKSGAEAEVYQRHPYTDGHVVDPVLVEVGEDSVDPKLEDAPNGQHEEQVQLETFLIEIENDRKHV